MPVKRLPPNRSIGPNGEVSNFLMKDYEAALNFIESQKKKKM
jgi:hypothetical protein